MLGGSRTMSKQTTRTSHRDGGRGSVPTRAGRLSRVVPAAMVLVLGVEAMATALPIGSPSAQALAPGVVSVSHEHPAGAAAGHVRLRLPLPLKETPGPVVPEPAPATSSATSATVRIDVEITDQTAPTVTMRPGPAGKKGRGLRLSAYASDDVAVAGVAFYRGDTRLALASPGRDGEWTADLTAADVAHLTARAKGAMPGPVYAVAVDAAGNVGRSGHAHLSVAD